MGNKLRIKPLEERGARNDAFVPHELIEIPHDVATPEEYVQKVKGKL